ncbi:PEP-CTERM sorting domain-containing protein [Sphingomonas sp. ID1715]|nr:PEP-CTERM sorting domain-containing protein [Sphingomonas sp. ID1715]
MYLRDRFSGSGTLDLKGYIATWDGSKAGTLLYSSGVQTMNAAATLQEFAFAPNIAVTPGQEYVAFLSISDLPEQSDSTFRMPVSGNTIPGLFVFMNNGTNFGDLFVNGWSQGFLGDNDVWLKVDFNGNAVPEPATWAMMIAGFGLAGAGMRRRAVKVAFA